MVLTVRSAIREILLRMHALQWALLLPLADVGRRYRALAVPRGTAVVTSAVPGAQGSLKLWTITRADELAAFRPRWEALFEAAGCRLPFLHFSWIEQWWRTFGRSLPLVRNTLEILVVEDGERTVGILPFYETTYGALRAFGMRYVRPLGSDPNLTEVRTGLLLPGYERAVLAEAERYFARRAEKWDLLNWGSYPDPLTPSADVAGHWFSIDRHDPTEMFLVSLPDGWETFAGALKRNTKEAVRRAHNALKRDGRQVSFRCLESPQTIVPLLPKFFDLHHRRARLEDTVRHPDLFARRAHKRFLRGLVRSMGEQNLLKLFVLDVDGEVAAMRVGFTIGDTLYCYYSGFDPVFAKYSVATRLVVEMMRWAMGRGIATVNLSTGRDQSKLRWSPQVVQLQTYSQIGRRFRSRAAFAFFARP